MAGKSKVEEYLGDLRSIVQNYANEHPEIKLTNLESLSEEQLRELIKKKENSWYVIKAVSYTHLDVYKRQGANDYITKPFSLMVLRARVSVKNRDKERTIKLF